MGPDVCKVVSDTCFDRSVKLSESVLLLNVNSSTQYGGSRDPNVAWSMRIFAWQVNISRSSYEYTTELPPYSRSPWP
jgi:hypothetical protein